MAGRASSEMIGFSVVSTLGRWSTVSVETVASATGG
jgi:hypothetical protein